MALSFLAGGGSASHAKYFDIRWVRSHDHIASAVADTSTRRLNDDYIVFRGDEDEAASAHLKGTLVLCLSEPLSIKHLKLHLKGMSRVWWVLAVLPSFSPDSV